LWEALTGRRLFFAPDSRDVVELLLTLPIPPPSSVAPHLSSELDAVVLKALARDVDERFASAHEFAEALRRVAGEGSRREVAEWVGRVAREGLEHRLELLQALEASAIHTQVAVALPVVTGSSPQAAPVLEGTHTQALTTSTSILPHPPPSPARRRAPLLVAVAGVSCALLVWLLTRPTEPPRLPARAVAAAPPVAPAPSVALALASPARESEPNLPVVAAESMPILSAAPSAAPKVPKKAAVPPVVTGPVRARACNPPYRIDAAGVRRVKPECL
jgi:serine/threonine-protein kinase